MGFWKKFGKGLAKAAPIAVALTPTPFDDIALNLGKQFVGMPPEQKTGALRILLGEVIREINPGLSDDALALAVADIMQIIRRKAAGNA